MTSSNISKVMANYQAAGLSKGNADLTKKTESADAVFAVMIGQMNPDTKQQMDLPVQKKTPTDTSFQVEHTESISDSSQFKDYSSNNDSDRIKKAADVENVVKEKVDDLTEETKEAIQNVVQEELSVTEEELNAALEQLGFSLMDLLIPANLVQLVSKLTDVEENSNLLMSEEFVDVMQELNNITANLAKELSISPQELERMLSEAMEQTEQPEVMEQLNEPDGPIVIARSEVVTDQPSEPIEQLEEKIVPSQPKEISSVDEVVVEAKEPKQVEELVVEQQNTKENPQQSDGKTDSNAGGQTMFADRETKSAEHSMFEANISQQAVQGHTAENVNVPVTPVYTTNVNVEEVLRQIAEFVRVSVTQDTSSIEMQLNPENLGKLYLQLTATREGAVTAQFAAQNEAVKEALEAQVVELRQTLNQQGIKVDAIEVTVATHEFERNLEQNAEGEQRREEQAQKHRGRRNLNLNSLDELSGLMSEEEMLAVKIMRENGNSMDVTA